MSPLDDLSLFLFDSWYDMYSGVICLMAVQNGILKQGSGITFISRCILRQENILPNRYLLVQSSNSTMETVGAIKAPE